MQRAPGALWLAAVLLASARPCAAFGAPAVPTAGRIAAAAPPPQRAVPPPQLTAAKAPSPPAPALAPPSPPFSGARSRAWHEVEYRALRVIQRVPGLLSISIGVHYSLLPKVITPLLALLVWLVSLPRAASLITFVCAQDLVNTAVKWAVQRPRPRWYSADPGLVSRCGAWEVDLSFPSAHTQFFSGLAFCGCGLLGWPASAALGFGLVVGLTRNYLSVHWPTDTLAGLLIGGGLGLLWARHDPYALLLRAASPALSVGAASALTGALLGLLLLVRRLVPEPPAEYRATWYANAVASLPAAEREATLANPKRLLQARSLRAKIPMLATVWATLAITGAYPALLPSAAAEPVGGLAARALHAVVGVGGLGAVDGLKTCVGGVRFRAPAAAPAAEGCVAAPDEPGGGARAAGGLERGAAGRGPATAGTAPAGATGLADTCVDDAVAGWSRDAKDGLKGLTYLAICAWTFLLSQRMAHVLLRGVGLPAP